MEKQSRTAAAYAEADQSDLGGAALDKQPASAARDAALSRIAGVSGDAASAEIEPNVRSAVLEADGSCQVKVHWSARSDLGKATRLFHRGPDLGVTRASHEFAQLAARAERPR